MKTYLTRLTLFSALLLFLVPIHGAYALSSKECLECHSEKAENFSRSIHKELDCTDCHQIKNFPHRRRRPVDCGTCHADIKKLYEQSVHGRARIKSGLVVAPTCNTCHNAHDVKLHSDPSSITYKTKIPYICGKCHAGILSEYKNSIHGKELLGKKNIDAPACTNCHGIHVIAEAFRPEANISLKNIPQTCGKCHAEETLMQKYGIKTDLIETYRETFHGRANLYGQLTTANCSSCHGIHNILKRDDPDSQVSKQNLPKTCGKCHLKARNNPNFSNVIMHLKPSRAEEPLVFYVRLFYLALITLIIGGMLVYNIFDFIKRLTGKKKHV